MKHKKFDPFDVDFVLKINKGKLTSKQEAFCREYIRDYDSTGAYIRAGYKSKRPVEAGKQLLKQPAITEYMKELTKDILDELELDNNFVLRGYKDLALNGKDDKIKKSAYDSLAKHLGMFNNNIEHIETKPTSIVVNIVKDEKVDE